MLICLQADCTSADVAEWNKVDSFDSNYDFLNNPLEEKCDYQVIDDRSFCAEDKTSKSHSCQISMIPYKCQKWDNLYSLSSTPNLFA